MTGDLSLMNGFRSSLAHRGLEEDSATAEL